MQLTCAFVTSVAECDDEQVIRCMATYLQGSLITLQAALYRIA